MVVSKNHKSFKVETRFREARQLRSANIGNDARYEIILYWSQGDQAFIAEVPELVGCAADGATYREALEKIEIVIREWIETACDLGRSVPEPRGRLMDA
jgi:predicted RNase H-like HicB family nuclease